MSKLLTMLLLATATTAFAGDLTIQAAQAQIEKMPCKNVEVWEQPGQCARGQSDCTSFSTKDGAITILNGYKSNDYKAVVNSCSVQILDKNYKSTK